MKPFKSRRKFAPALWSAAAAAFLASAAYAQVGPLAPSASDIDGNVSAALTNLYSTNQAARTLGAQAIAILVFPDIRKGAFLVGAQYGFGALRMGSKTAGYYRTAAVLGGVGIEGSKITRVTLNR